MFVSDILNIIIDIKYKSFYNDITIKNNFKKEIESHYKLESEKPLLICGFVNLFSDGRNTIYASIPNRIYKYLIYISYSYNNTWKLIELDSIEEVEDFILKPGGVLNYFVTDLIVLENLKHKNYKVFEVLPNGNKKEIADFDECTKDIEPNLMVQWY